MGRLRRGWKVFDPHFHSTKWKNSLKGNSNEFEFIFEDGRTKLETQVFVVD